MQRPGIDAIVDVDLAALRSVGGWLSHVRLVSERADMPALVEEFAPTSLEEIDYLHEAANCRAFADDFADDDRVAVPEVVWERTTRRVLTLEDVSAIKITDADALAAAGIDPAEVRPVFASVMFDQLFTNGFFHADPHPGNIFVTPDTDSAGRAPVEADVHRLRHDGRGSVPYPQRPAEAAHRGRLARRQGAGDAIRDVGVLVPSADTAELERAMTHLFARFGGMGFAELREVDPREFRDFAVAVRRPSSLAAVPAARELPAHHPRDVADLGCVQRARRPFNLWDSVEPYAAQLLRDERGNIVQDVAQQALDAASVAAAAAETTGWACHPNRGRFAIGGEPEPRTAGGTA